jgi:hypothetical protein
MTTLYHKFFNCLVTTTRNVLYLQEKLMLSYLDLLQTNFIIPNTLIIIPGTSCLVLFAFSILSLYTLTFIEISEWSFACGFLGNLTYLQTIIFLLASFLTGFILTTINNMIKVNIVRDDYLVNKILDVRNERNKIFSNLLYKENNSNNIPIATEVELVNHEHNE